MNNHQRRTTWCTSVLGLLSCFWSLSHCVAAIAPSDLKRLQNSAELIVVGTVTQDRIEVEASRNEPGYGNEDWAIYLTIAVDAVEKGELENEQKSIEVRCFRLKSRRSNQEYLTDNGHSSIPAAGTQVRAYLKRTGSTWRPLSPNGITSATANDDDRLSDSEGFSDADEMVRVPRPRYTFLLPLELWFVLLVISTPIVIFVGIYWKRKKRQTATS